MIDNSELESRHLNGSRLHLNTAALPNLQATLERISGSIVVKTANRSTGMGTSDSGLRPETPSRRNEPIRGGLKIFCLNINGLLRHLDEIRILVDEKQSHILLLNETKTDDSIDDYDIEIEDYIINRRDRNSFGGGVAIYVHKNIQFTLRDDLKIPDLETVTVEVNLLFVRPIILSTLYRPEGPVAAFDKIESMISKITGEKKEFILMGDLNCDLLSMTLNKTKHIVQIYKTYGLVQVIKEATRTTSDTHTLIDHIVTNKIDRIAESGVMPCGISDHDVIYIIRHARLSKMKKDPKILSVRDTRKLDNDRLLENLRELPFGLIKDTSNNPEDLWLKWKTFFLNILDKHAPVKTIRVRGNNLPYVTAEVKSMMRQRDYLSGKANKTGSKYLRQAFQQVRNKVDFTLRNLKSEYYTRKIEENKNNLKNTWKGCQQRR